MEESFTDEVVDEEEDEETQVQLSPHVQMYLAQVGQEAGCWGMCLPIPFERAAGRSWWDPTFDSEILEDQFRKSAYTHHRLKFRYALWYVLLISFCWFIYFLTSGLLAETRNSSAHWPKLCTALATLILITIAILSITYTRFYNQNTLTLISVQVSLFLCVISLSFMQIASTHADITSIGHFTICTEILLLIYTVIPLKLYLCIIISVLYTVCFELLHRCDEVNTQIVRVLSHVCIHLIGLHILVMSNVRMRNTFMKVGQSLLVHRQLEGEKKLKENMIHSLMPQSVAAWLLNDDFTKNPRNSQVVDIQSLFRPFNMNRVENVSILFADIVGFTKMSTKKSAEQLVEILNNLFRRFDALCKLHNCEKISTLGDCYYCVSGCPEPRSDHAHCCVEMGLGMIEAIADFDREMDEGVNMRVGVHTGTVLCGIVGTRRFKFDVWSNDVTLANRMEATGKPGLVHISENTLKHFLNQNGGGGYVLDEGEQVFGLKTYFILGKKPAEHHHRASSHNGSLKGDHAAAPCQQRNHSLQLIISPPTTTTNNSSNLSPQTRPRVLSCDTSHAHDTSLLKPFFTNHNPNTLSPHICKIKASSLPSILDSENETELITNVLETSIIKTPTSTASERCKSIKIKAWKIPKFLRKSDLSDNVSANLSDNLSAYNQVPTIIETQNDVTLEQIDVKSYISQSRSDVLVNPNELSRFIRSGSYRSQYGGGNNTEAYLSRAGSNRSRRGQCLDFTNCGRDRSATIGGGGGNIKKYSLDVPLSTIYVNQPLNLSNSSVGPSMNSRKDSGIKSNSRRSSIQPLDTNVLAQRVSGYYTSQSSLDTNKSIVADLPTNNIQSLRKQSDRQLIKCVQDNSKSKRSYFIKPPLTQISLFFLDQKMEANYRTNVHNSATAIAINTLANTNINTYFDVFVSATIFFIISCACFALAQKTQIPWIITFILCIIFQLIAIMLCFQRVSRFLERNLSGIMPRWYRWNIFGGALISLPLIAVLINYYASDCKHIYLYLLLVGVIHYCNFTQLNCWMKNLLVTAFCAVFVGLLLRMNEAHKFELIMDLGLLLSLIWVLNREFEIGYRLSFHANFVANRDRFHVQSLKNQADWLIYNIVPEHVAEQLKLNAKYSENFNNVAIIFASIVNFNEMYDESYLGGKEFLRVLNELIGDFDELLTLDEFASVEKIKTIGSTFMAASGLDSRMREAQADAHAHLYALMDFAIAMQHVIDDFNRDLLGFTLVLRIGYNFGDVTAAVIGETKLYYDIWGDAVNVASRMDSTGVKGRIQVGQHCLPILQNHFVFEKRGSVYVKGKDNMDVYLLTERICD